MNEIAKTLIIAGAVLIFIGVMANIFPGFGRLPGDIIKKKENFTFYFPITSSIIISLILTLIFFLWNRR